MMPIGPHLFIENMATTKCDVCPIRTGCDWLSEMCRLSPREVVGERPDLIKPSRAEKLRRRDAQRRDERILRDLANPTGVFARRRLRQAGRI